jgi:hypothetical protein
VRAGRGPSSGLLGPPPSGCLIQPPEFGFSLSPHVLHVGEAVQARLTLTTPDAMPRATWSWSNIEAVIEKGLRRDQRPKRCSDQAMSCTLEAGPGITSAKWQVCSMGADVPVVGGMLAGAVSSDYFIVDDQLHQLSGTVRFDRGPSRAPMPVAGVAVQVTGDGGSAVRRTGADGAYSFALPRGHYQVSLTGHRGSQPATRSR